MDGRVGGVGADGRARVAGVADHRAAPDPPGLRADLKEVDHGLVRPPLGLCIPRREEAEEHGPGEELLRLVGHLLDDFGSGMSSFGYLKHLPVDALKIDGAFVRLIAKDPVARAMVGSINEIGHLMGLRTIAEFVEDAEILAELRLLGVDAAQGYGLAPPAPLQA